MSVTYVSLKPPIPDSPPSPTNATNVFDLRLVAGGLGPRNLHRSSGKRHV